MMDSNERAEFHAACNRLLEALPDQDEDVQREVVRQLHRLRMETMWRLLIEASDRNIGRGNMEP